jgi:hypothetical protein
MVLGRPLREATSRRGNASPFERKALNRREEWTTDLTRYRSRWSGAVDTGYPPRTRTPYSFCHAEGKG